MSNTTISAAESNAIGLCTHCIVDMQMINNAMAFERFFYRPRSLTEPLHQELAFLRQ